MTRVYVAGSHATGKSILAREIARVYDLPLIDEVARQVLAAGKYGDLERLRTDPPACRAFQRAVWRGQLEAEARLGDDNFVSDRTFDNVCYWQVYAEGVRELIDSEEFRQYVERVRAPDSVVLFARPERAFLRRDGVRTEAELDLEVVGQFDGLTLGLLETYGVQYVPIRGEVLKERMMVVRAALRGVGLLPKSGRQ